MLRVRVRREHTSSYTLVTGTDNNRDNTALLWSFFFFQSFLNFFLCSKFIRKICILSVDLNYNRKKNLNNQDEIYEKTYLNVFGVTGYILNKGLSILKKKVFKVEYEFFLLFVCLFLLLGG